MEGCRYYILLKPRSDNSKYRPIIVAQAFRIQGVVCRLFKKGGLIWSAFRQE